MTRIKVNIELQPLDETPVSRMTWNEAQAYVTSLGPDWRLPTNEELSVLQPTEFNGKCYWSGTENTESEANICFANKYGIRPNYKLNESYVRAVRTI